MAEESIRDVGRDRIALRDLPPVAPVRWPERISMTLARYLNRCPRSAYLYVGTGGGAPTLEMDRGTLTHAGNALLMARRMEHEGGDMTPAAHMDEALSQFTAEIVREAGEGLPELWVDHEQRDVARLCVFHTALGLDVNPGDVLGIERKFVLELECGWPVSGIIDLASLPAERRGQVDDYKTQLHVPPYDEWDWFQQKLYCAMVMFGRPVERETCGHCGGSGVLDFGAGDVNPPGAAEKIEVGCEDCKHRGWIEVPGDPVGGSLTHMTGRELYPRHDPRKRSDGKLARLERTWTRLELQELVIDLNDQLGRLDEMLQTWKFPARAGTKACGECPAESLCPIPRGYRRFAGHVQSVEQAQEAWAWAKRSAALVKATEEQVKEFCAVQGIALKVGEEVWEHELGEQRKLKTKSGRADWDGLAAAIEAGYDGAEFALADWVKSSQVSSFKKRKVRADNSGAATPPASSEVAKPEPEVKRGVDAEERRDDQWGSDAPY